MELVPGICTQCGATLSVKKDEDAMVCPYCDTPFIVKKAIQIFNNTYIYNVTNNITAEKVIVQGGINNDFEIVGGVLRGYSGSSTNIIIPNDVIAIGDRVFERTKIEAVAMSNNVTEIGNGAFYGCNNLKTVTFSQNIKWIGDYAFSDCTCLGSIELPNGLKSIGKDAFSNCSCLENVVLPEGLTSVAIGCFEGIAKLNLYLPDSLNNIDFVKNVHESIHLSSVLLDKFECFTTSAKSIYVDSREITVNELKNNQFLRQKLSQTKIGQEFFRTEAEKREMWRSENRCQYCGGGFKGFFTLTCRRCGRIKDYDSRPYLS